MEKLIPLIKQLSTQNFEKFWDIRCAIHSNPELSFKEFDTSKLVKKILTELEINFEENWVETGIVATLKGNSPSGKTIALRADLDALPIEELNTTSYVSKNLGVMHACGHDFHTASLLGTASLLIQLKEFWDGEIKLIFQPGEEVLPGGAKLMLEQGLLQKHSIQKIIAQHVTPEIDTGKVGIKSGLFMASTDEIHINVKGIGGHAAQPHLYRNPIVALSRIIDNVNEYYLNTHHPIPTVIAFGSFIANGATNVIPENAFGKGTIRTFNEDYRVQIHEKLIAICKEIELEYKVVIECNIIKGYPFLVNDEGLTNEVKKSSSNFLGESNVLELPHRMTAEDFAYYSQKIPSCFYRIGTGNVNKGITSGVHTATFDVDKNSLATAMGLMTFVAIMEMKNGQ